MKRIGIVGSTGSIGRQALDVISQNRDRFDPVFLSTNSNKKELLQQKEMFPDAKLSLINGEGEGILSGIDGLVELIRSEGADMILLAAVGAAGIIPAYETVDCGIDLALANKESIVAAASIIMSRAEETGAKVLPVDSEHSAIFQSMAGHRKEDIKKIELTASGGSFRDMPLSALENVTVEQALKHPNWTMGSKITIDSSTMMNKGLELIEARYLFDVAPEMLDVLIHPESIIHSMVTYIDGSSVAQLGYPDMRTPISYALGYPERAECSVSSLDLAEVSKLTFRRADMQKYRCLGIAIDVLKNDVNGPMIAMNAANEVAVDLFLQGKIRFLNIADIIQDTLDACDGSQVLCLEEILERDFKAREHALSLAVRYI